MKHKLIAENRRAGEEEVTTIPDHCWYDSFDNEYDYECGGQSLLQDNLEKPPE
jgi:hypothetical protein